MSNSPRRGSGHHRNSCAYPETIPGYLGPWMAGFDSYLRAGRSSRGSSSSRPLGRGSLVSTRSRLSPHLCNGSYCLPSACPVLFDSRTYRLQNDTWGVLFLFLYGNSGQYFSSRVFPQEFLPPPGSLAMLDLSSFLIVQMIWAVALWRPLPVDDRLAASPSNADYQRLSPEINEHLRLLNEKLLRLWKVEARSQ